MQQWITNTPAKEPGLASETETTKGGTVCLQLESQKEMQPLLETLPEAQGEGKTYSLHGPYVSPLPPLAKPNHKEIDKGA